MSNVIDIYTKKHIINQQSPKKEREEFKKKREVFFDELHKFFVDYVSADPDPEFDLMEVSYQIVRLAADIIEYNDVYYAAEFRIAVAKSMQIEFEERILKMEREIGAPGGGDDDAA